MSTKYTLGVRISPRAVSVFGVMEAHRSPNSMEWVRFLQDVLWGVGVIGSTREFDSRSIGSSPVRSV